MKPATVPSDVTQPHQETKRANFEVILAAVDLSPVSTKTLEVAGGLATKFGSRLIVTHVVPLKTTTRFQRMAALEPIIDKLTEPLCLGGMDVEDVIAEAGSVDRGIENMVAQEKADLLVIGTHGEHGIEKFLLGSTAERIFRSARIPVLTVGPHAEIPSRPFSAMLFATDLKPHSLRAAQYASSLAQECEAKLMLVHVTEAATQPAEFHRDALSKLKQLVPEGAELWCKPLFKTEIGRPASVILSTAREMNADLIVLSVEHSSFLADHASWSTVSQVIREASCPVLTLCGRL